MFKRLMFFLALPLIVFGGNLTLQNGLIQAHTEVFADASIDPSVSSINTDLSIQNGDITSLQGIISFKIIDFKSSNSGRDEHMQEMFEMDKFSDISLKINKVSKVHNDYTLDGLMTIHGVSKDIRVNCDITQDKDMITIASNFIVKVTDYGMEPPSLLFFTVRDDVDINASLKLKMK